MSDPYYIRIRGRVQGPFDAEKLRNLARRGQFSRLHEISTDGQQWQSAKAFQELFAPVEVPVAASSGVAEPALATGTNGAVASMAAPAASPTWYYAAGGREQGPVAFAVLANLLSTRQLQPDTEVWTQGMTNWMAASSVPAIASTLAASVNDRAGHNDQPAIDDGSTKAGKVSPSVVRALAESRSWVLFIAVIGFLYAGLLLVGGIVQIILGSRAAMSPVTAGGLLNLVFGLVVAFGAWQLLSYAAGIAQLERSRSDQAICSALSTLKSFWVYVGINLIVVLTLLVLAAIFVLSVAGSFPTLN